MVDLAKAKRGRNITVLVYAAASALVFGARLIYAIAEKQFHTLMDQFWLVVSAIGLAIGVSGAVILGVQLIRSRSSGSQREATD